jgi:hypothetical protein
MSFLTDLFHGNFDKLGTDITHAPDSLSRHPLEIAETLGGLGLVAAPFAVPAIGSALGIGEAAVPVAAGEGISAFAPEGADAAISATGALDTAAPFAEGGGQFAGAGAGGAFGGEDALAGTYGGTAGTGGVGAGIGDTASSIGGYLGKAAGGIGGWLANNPALALGAGYLGYKALTGGQQLPQQGNLQDVANQAQSLATSNQALEKQLTDPLLTGNLPEGQKRAIAQGVQDAQTAIKARYAQLGMSGSTAETDALNHAQEVGMNQAAALEQSMAQMGIQAGSAAAQDLGIANTVYSNIMNATISQDNALQSAIASFAGQAGNRAATRAA